MPLSEAVELILLALSGASYGSTKTEKIDLPINEEFIHESKLAFRGRSNWRVIKSPDSVEVIPFKDPEDSLRVNFSIKASTPGIYRVRLKRDWLFADDHEAKKVVFELNVTEGMHAD